MRSKGRSGTSGFLLGLFLGAVSVIIAAALSADPNHEAEKLRKQLELMGYSPEQARGAVLQRLPDRDGSGPEASHRAASTSRTPKQLERSAAAMPVAVSAALGFVTYALFDSDDLLRPFFFVIAFGLSIVAIKGKSREMAAIALGTRLSYQFGVGLFLVLTGNTYWGWGRILGYLMSDGLALFAIVLAFRLSSQERSVRGANPFALVTAAVAVISVAVITFGKTGEGVYFGDYYSSGLDQERLAIVVALILPIILAGLAIAVPTRSRLVYAASYCIMSILAATASGLTSKWFDNADSGVAYLWTVALFGTAVLGIYAIISSQPDATSSIPRKDIPSRTSPYRN